MPTCYTNILYVSKSQAELWHYKRICRELPVESDQTQILDYAEARYRKLKAAKNIPPPPEAQNAPPPDDEHPALRLVDCPAKGEQVSVGYCDTNCDAREGCPAHEQPSKLTIEV